MSPPPFVISVSDDAQEETYRESPERQKKVEIEMVEMDRSRTIRARKNKKESLLAEILRDA